ncbi:TonB-dependent receptor [Lampropedia puyangensis]|uniref:TonB-dependent receptor n=1 Tax=Lampropedia puyangensis TaxID=1330072 RepID=A0A4S8EWJ5_9BURK|nr:TonB-dependent receptor [Lampropedia puyangensis]THT99259.1 TonB-dependent receptor [Lampropedia puyangensis]
MQKHSQYRQPFINSNRAALAKLSTLTLLLCSCAGLTVVAQTVSEEPKASQPMQRVLQIQSGPLEPALIEFQRWSGQPIQAPAELLRGRQTQGVSNGHSFEAALKALLTGTGLHAQRDEKGQLVLQPAASLDVAADTALPEVTVMGSSLETDLQKYPGSVTVLSQDDLSRTSSVIEAMAAVPGVTTGGDSGRSTGQQFNIRGFGYQSEDRVIVLQDGVRRSTALFSNHISTFRSDNDLLKRVEIVKGASSVQHGGGAIGGVVAMTNKEASDFLPQGKEAGVATKLRYEHNNYREAYAAAAYAPADKPVELLAYVKRGTTGDLTMSRNYGRSASGEDIDKVDNDEDLQVLFLQGAVKPTPDQRIALSYYDYQLDNETTWQTLYHSNYSSVTGPVKGKLRQRDVVAKYHYSAPDVTWLNVNASAYHSKANYDRGYAYTNTNNGVLTDLSYDNIDKRTGLRLSNEAFFQSGALKHRLIAGMDYEKRREDAVYLLNGELSDFGSMPNTYKDLGVYGHLESTLLNDRLVVQLGGRYDRFDRSVDRHEGGYRGSHFSPRIGASLEVASGLNLLANWSEAFRAPTPHETSSEGPLNPHYWYVPNPDLDPETIRETEFGVSYTKYALLTPGDVLRTKLMLFNGRIRDMIALKETRTEELSPQDSPYASYVNIDRVKRRGFEWQGAYERSLFGFGASYAHLKQTNQATGLNTPQSFADKLALNGYVRPAHGLKLGAEVTHWRKPKQNPQTIRSGGTTYWYVRDDFTITNVFADWTPNPAGQGAFGRDFSIRFGVNNLFDATYINARDVETTGRIGKGRNVYLSMQTRF